MAQSILFIGYDLMIEKEIRDYISDKEPESFFTPTPEKAIQILDNHVIDKVVLNLRSMHDAVILRYVNRYYQGIEVVISASQDFDEVISVFRQNKFKLLHRPFRLEELKMVL